MLLPVSDPVAFARSMKEAEVITTDDGSRSIYLPALQEQYHSRFGALAESVHIYINCGLLAVPDREISIFELGFGTGLNTLLTLKEASNKALQVRYTSIELYPLTEEMYTALDHASILNFHDNHSIKTVLTCRWNAWESITPYFSLKKLSADLLEYRFEENFHLVYFDAFAPAVQPALWTTSLFSRIYGAMFPGGILVTYSSQSQVQRNLREAGFRVTKLPGPPGKREIIRAIKP